jgi:hypothetical protein
MSSGKILNTYEFKLSDEFDLSSDIIYKEGPLVIDPGFNVNSQDNLLYKIIEIHFLLKTNPKLTNNERLDYCRVERNLMIQYLKKVVKKV